MKNPPAPLARPIRDIERVRFFAPPPPQPTNTGTMISSDSALSFIRPLRSSQYSDANPTDQ